MATEGGGDRSRMGRNNTSYIVYIVVAVILATLLYFSWSLNTQVKGARAEKRSLESELSRSEGELNKLKSQVQSLGEEIQSLNRQKSLLESEKDKISNELNEAKATIVSESTKVTEARATNEQVQQKLDEKTEELSKLKEEKESISDKCEKAKEECTDQKEKLDSCETHMQTLKSELTEQKSRFHTLGSNKEALASQFDSQGEELKSAHRQLQECRYLLSSYHASKDRAGEGNRNENNANNNDNHNEAKTNDHNIEYPTDKDDPRHSTTEKPHPTESKWPSFGKDSKTEEKQKSDAGIEKREEVGVGDDHTQKKPTDSPHDDGEDGQGGPPMLGVGGEEEKQGDPQNPDLVLGINQPGQQPEKQGGGAEGPQLRGNEQAPDYRSDTDTGNKYGGDSDTAGGKDTEGDTKDGPENKDKDNENNNGDTAGNKDNDGGDGADSKDTGDSDAVGGKDEGGNPQSKDGNKDSEDDGAVPNKSDPLETDKETEKEDFDHLSDLFVQEKKPHTVKTDGGDKKDESPSILKRDVEDNERHLPEESHLRRPDFNPLRTGEERDEKMKEDEIRSLFRQHGNDPNFDQRLQEILNREGNPRDQFLNDQRYRDGRRFPGRNPVDEGQLEQPFRNRDDAIERMRGYGDERMREFGDQRMRNRGRPTRNSFRRRGDF